MSDARPELVFVAGPQAGERAVLVNNVVPVGRSPEADVHVREEHVSRKHLQLTLTPVGWVLDIFSPERTRINGKKYRKGRKILLGTGDVIMMGAETQVLFVDAGDDVEEALGAWREAAEGVAQAPPAAAEAPEDVSEAPPPREERPAPEPPPAKAPAKAPAAEPEAAESFDPDAAARKAKLRKYAIFGGIYALVLIVVVVFLFSLSERNDGAGPSDIPKVLTKKDIEGVFRASRGELGGKVSPNAVSAVRALDDALALYPGRDFRNGDRYRCVKSFELHLAYSTRDAFESPQHELMLQRARDELIEDVWRKYRSAWAFEQAHKWEQAWHGWRTVMETVPEVDAKFPARKIYDNAFQHSKYVNKYRQR